MKQRSVENDASCKFTAFSNIYETILNKLTEG